MIWDENMINVRNMITNSSQLRSELQGEKVCN